VQIRSSLRRFRISTRRSHLHSCQLPADSELGFGFGLWEQPTPTASASATHSHLSVVLRSFALPVAVAPLRHACARYHHPSARFFTTPPVLCPATSDIEHRPSDMHHNNHSFCSSHFPIAHPPSPLTNVDSTWIRQLTSQSRRRSLSHWQAADI